MSSIEMANATNAVIQGGKPIKTYRKGILGKVHIHVWNSFEEKPQGIILEGREGSEEAMYDLWNEKEVRFFEMMNKRQIETSYLVITDRDNINLEDKKISIFTDVELEKVLRDKYFTLMHFLDEVDSEPIIFRLLTLAERIEKPAKTVDAIKSRLAELQAVDVADLKTKEL